MKSPVSATQTLPALVHCWKEQGVWGKNQPDCPTLKRVIHCRNCEVFTRAGRNLLERELPQDYLQDWSQVLAVKKDENALGTLSILMFRIEQEWLALPSLLFAEVIEPAKIHSLPHRSNPALLGVVNVHGEVQLCVSLQALLGISKQTALVDNPHRSLQRMLVMDRSSERWVFPVDEIHGIHRIHPSQLENPPISVSKAGIGFTKAIFPWDGKLVALLEDEFMLYKLTRSVQ